MLPVVNVAEEACCPPDSAARDEFDTIFVAAYRHRSGKLMIAANYGLKAFALRVRKKS